MTPNLKICSVLAVCMGLFACGGGGGSSPVEPTNPPTTAPAPPPAPVVLDPLTSVPPPTYTDERADAFNRLNEIRQQVGLGLMAQNDKLDVAAQGHSNYMASGGTGGHFQVRDLPTFTGRTPLDRIAAAGYPATRSSTIDEAISFDPFDRVSIRRNIDLFLDAPYHRISFLNHATIDVGMGLSPALGGSIEYFVIDFGYYEGRRQGAPLRPYVVWPQADTTVSSLGSPPERPSPPGLGYAPSIHVDPSRVLKVDLFEMRDGSGALVPATVLKEGTDPNLRGTAFVSILSPAAALTAATRYTVRFVGTSNDQPLNVEWSFRTP